MPDHPSPRRVAEVAYRLCEQTYRMLNEFPDRTDNLSALGNTLPVTEIWQTFRDFWR